MITVLSNKDALLVAAPMIGLLVACHFRIDELLGKPRKPRKSMGRKLVGMQSGASLDPGPSGSGGEARGLELPEKRRPRVRVEVE